MRKRYIWTAYVLLFLAALACNRTVPTATSPAAIAASATGVAPATVSATPFDNTPVALTYTPGCIFDAGFVADVTIPDNTKLRPGTEFAKTWRLRNSGTCAWDTGTSWEFDSGDRMNGPSKVAVPATQPGDTIDITVELTAPALPGTYTGYWQMRGADNKPFGARSFVTIAVVDDRATASPTVSRTPTPTAAPENGPVIHYFHSNVEWADPGDTVALEWGTEGAANAILYHLLPTGQLGSFWDVDVNGVFEYEIGVDERNHTDFMLIVGDDLGRTAQTTLSIELHCPDAWFFEPAPEVCPAGSVLTSSAAEERFEHGVMVWVEEQDLIYVLFDDGSSPWWRAFADDWDEGQPVDDPTIAPPEGKLQPVRGFGLVWRTAPGVRERLGWAVSFEAAYTTAVQRTSRPKYNDIYIRALDDGIWRLLPESSGWEKISQP